MPVDLQEDQKTALYRLVETKLGKPLGPHLAQRRASNATYQDLVYEFRTLGVTTTTETVRRWCFQLELPNPPITPPPAA